MSDKYVLENLPKILQKVANDSVAQFKEKFIKARGNVSLNTAPQGTANFENNSDKEKEEATLWDA